MLKTGEVILTSGTRSHVDRLHDALLSYDARILSTVDILSRSFPRPALLFIDWLLPEMSGLQLCRLLRASPASDRLNITLLLESGTEGDRRRALEAGADDYLSEPLTPQLLVERVRRLSPAGTPAPANLAIGELVIDPSAFSVRFGPRSLPLGVNEMSLLIHFARNPNRVFTRSELIGSLGKDRSVADERTVDVWVSRLRRSLASHGVPHLPRTVRAIGYVMDL